MNIQEAIARVVEKRDLAVEEMKSAMEIIMSGRATPAQIGSFLTALRMKGETVDEITGAAMVMREKATHVNAAARNGRDTSGEGAGDHDEKILDTCGTGGDRMNTFNISTATAFVAAGAGVKVAKHGNRSVSSACGSADVWEALGMPLSLTARDMETCIQKFGICLLYAPALHEAMKHAAGPRKDVGIRTLFNLLGPLTNPAGAAFQLLGVYKRELVETVARVLGKLGCTRAMVVHGEDGLDEITVSGHTHVAEWNRGTIHTYRIHPEALGISPSTLSDLRGGTARENAGIILDIFKGRKGPPRDAVIINAAAALYVAEHVATLDEGVRVATAVIDEGKALATLNAVIEWAHRFS